jgi:hypothetical protein
LLEGLGVTEAPFEEWMFAERLRLREMAVEALGRLLSQQRARRARPTLPSGRPSG